MTCPFRLDLSPYLDGELDPLKAKKIEGHLADCVGCRQELSLLLEIRNCMKQAAISTKAPTPLRENILDEARRTHKIVYILRRNPAYVFPLVALLLVAAILSFHYHWPWERDTFQHVAAAMVQYHSGYESGERSPSIRSSSIHDVGLWLERKLDFEILIPRAAFAGYDLVGADIFEHRGITFVYLKYQKNSKTIGYVVSKDFALPIDLPETMEIGKITVHVGRIKETHVGVWKIGGLVYAILTTEDRSELVEYARECIRLF